MSQTRIELEQLRNSREYQDRLSLGPQAESGVDHNNDFNYVLSQIRQIIYGPTPMVASGVGNWFDSVPAGLSQLVATSGVGNNLTWTQTFNYGSGILNVSAFNGLVKMGVGKTFKFADANGNNPTLEIVDSSQVFIRKLGDRAYKTIVGTVNAGASITLPVGVSYTIGDTKFRNLRVYRNGSLMLPGSGVVSSNQNYNDYREVTSTTIVTNRKLKDGEILEFHVNG